MLEANAIFTWLDFSKIFLGSEMDLFVNALESFLSKSSIECRRAESKMDSWFLSNICQNDAEVSKLKIPCGQTDSA